MKVQADEQPCGRRNRPKHMVGVESVFPRTCTPSTKSTMTKVAALRAKSKDECSKKRLRDQADVHALLPVKAAVAGLRSFSDAETPRWMEPNVILHKGDQTSASAVALELGPLLVPVVKKPPMRKTFSASSCNMNDLAGALARRSKKA